MIQDDDQAGIVVIETGGATRVSEVEYRPEPDTIGVRLQSQPDYEPGTTTPADVTMTVVPGP